MRLDDLDPTDNARDLGSGGGGGGGGGFGLLGLLPLLLGRRMGCGTFVLIGLVLAVMYGPSLLSGGGQQVAGDQQQSASAGGSGQSVCRENAQRLEACRVMKSTELTWGAIFQKEGKQYSPATINFYSQGATSGCGYASSAVGPYYCPQDKGVYLDTSFFDELANRFGAKGDFARDYVVAHEIGHHVQDLLGISDQISQQQAQASKAEGNALSVRLELQADCFAGVWAAYNKDRLDPGDIEEGLTAAHQIGDDTLQQEAQGRVVPDSFTHGTSEQRMKWLKRGLDTGDYRQCDTINGDI